MLNKLVNIIFRLFVQIFTLLDYRIMRYSDLQGFHGSVEMLQLLLNTRNDTKRYHNSISASLPGMHDSSSIQVTVLLLLLHADSKYNLANIITYYIGVGTDLAEVWSEDVKNLELLDFVDKVNIIIM